MNDIDYKNIIVSATSAEEQKEVFCFMCKKLGSDYEYQEGGFADYPYVTFHKGYTIQGLTICNKNYLWFNERPHITAAEILNKHRFLNIFWDAFEDGVIGSQK